MLFMKNPARVLILRRVNRPQQKLAILKGWKVCCLSSVVEAPCISYCMPMLTAKFQEHGCLTSFVCSRILLFRGIGDGSLSSVMGKSRCLLS